jgi:hypothetical protein
MWTKLIEYLAKILLVPLLKKGAAALMDWFERKREQSKRHKENKAKVEAYDSAKPSEAKDEFQNLP